MNRTNSSDAFTRFLKNADAAYKKSLDNIKFRRSEWGQLRNLLSSFTQFVSSHCRLPIMFDPSREFEDYEAATIEFKTVPSGISRIGTGAIRPEDDFIYKTGARLTFAQTYNGKVLVVYEYPYIEGIIDMVDPVVKDSYEPEAINEDKLCEILGDFLNALTEWEQTAHVPKQYKPTKRDQFCQMTST